jgi:hypothetical protein
MPIYPLLQSQAFDPEQITARVAAEKTPKAVKAITTSKAANVKLRAAKAPKTARNAIAPTGTIRILVEGNPRRERTGRHAAFAVLRRFDGRTVAQFCEKGGSRGALRSALRHGWVRLEA